MKDIYTPKDVALETIAERRNNLELREKVAQYLGGRLPDACFLDDTPPALLARYVPRATDEDRLFANVAREAGFTPYWSSYVADRYTTRNPEKVQTIRPPIRWAKGQRTRQWIVNQEERDGGIGELNTVYGYTSADYQQGIRELVFGNDGNEELVGNTFDMTEWYRFQAPHFGWESGNLAAYYYPATMALATVFGVLYEDFDGGPSARNGDLAVFMNQIVYPAIAKVKEDIGVTPVIVKLPFYEGMNETGLEFLGGDESETMRKRGSRAVMSDRIGVT